MKEAREARDTARRRLVAGEDPAWQAALAAVTNTFEQIADEDRAKLAREGLAAGTLEKIDWYLTFVVPSLGKLDVRSITAAQVLEVLQTIESRRGKRRSDCHCLGMQPHARRTTVCEAIVCWNLKRQGRGLYLPGGVVDLVGPKAMRSAYAGWIANQWSGLFPRSSP